MDVTSRGRMETAISRALVGQQLVKRGFAAADVQDLLKDIDIDTFQVKDGKAVSTDSMKNFYGAYGMIILLYFTICFYGTNVGRSVVEEKTSRIFEVLLATTKAEYLMIGKLLGVSGAVMTQLAIWLAIFGGYAESSMAARAGIHGFSSIGINNIQLIFFCIFFVLGFLLYSAISAGFGAAMSSEQEMNQFAMIILLPLVLAYMLMFYVFQNPTSTVSVALSFFPLFTPILMCLRMAVQMPPLWQPILSVVVLLLSILGVIWIASRVYRVGILMYGKRPNLPEMLRWLRYS
jgi:ABC-2 type transport system permease protein